MLWRAWFRWSYAILLTLLYQKTNFLSKGNRAVHCDMLQTQGQLLNKIFHNLLFKTMSSCARIKIFLIERKYFGLNAKIFYRIQIYVLKFEIFLIEYKYFSLNKNIFLLNTNIFY